MNYSLSTVRRGLRNLFTQRIAALEASKAGAYYKVELHGYATEIGDLPAAIASAPFKDDLRTTDVRHDSLGKVIHLVTETCFVCPDVDPAIIAAAKQIRDAFIPSLDELQSPYAAEGERATERKPLLDSLEPQLSVLLALGCEQNIARCRHGLLERRPKARFALESTRRRAQRHSTSSRIATSQSRRNTQSPSQRLEKENRTRCELAPRPRTKASSAFFDTLHAMEAAGKGHEPVEGENEAPIATP
ncbi:MAG: hypothetical protein IPM54_12510 [Polyangiaceae bacterium]|nr:hypothetical protein [Polyangiaceae bacterium]